jgi:hypothetical protein
MQELIHPSSIMHPGHCYAACSLIDTAPLARIDCYSHWAPCRSRKLRAVRGDVDAVLAV